MPAQTTAAHPSITLRSRVAALLATLLIGGALSFTPAGAPSTASAAAAPTSEAVSATQIAGGGFVQCAIRTDQTLWCWGLNLFADSFDFFFLAPSVGLIGAGGKNEPQQVDSRRWLSVAVGENNVCGIVIAQAADTQGAIYCFGLNTDGQLGVSPSLVRQSVEPMQVGDSSNWTRVAVGDRHICAISNPDNSLWCIGDNAYSQLGLGAGNTTDQSEFQNTNNSANSVVAGESHTCFLGNGVAFCFGDNQSGQLGQGTTGGTSSDLVVVDGEHKFSALSAGKQFTCGVAINSTSFPSDAGKVYCWGSNSNGETGTSTEVSIRSTPTQVNTDVTFTSVRASGYHACGVTTLGKVYCWGSNTNEQSGEPKSVSLSLPHQVGTATNWAEVSLNEYTSCARTVATSSTPSATYCWGDRQSTGIGTASYFNVPIKVTGTGWLRVATNGNSRCAIQGSELPGRLFCWGANFSGEVGNGTIEPVRTPIEIIVPGGWREIAMGPWSTCGITGAGALACWGSNSSGRLGVGDTIDKLVPTRVGSDTDWSSISVGSGSACAIKSGTDVYCWGSDSSGALGNGAVLTDDQVSPSQVDFSGTGSHTWRKVSVGQSHACALDDAKKLYCWGDNGNGFFGGYGKLGDGTGDNRDAPVRSVAGMQFIDVTAGVASTCGVAVGGASWCWGMNLYGQLGNGGAMPDVLFFMGGVNSAFAGGSTAQIEGGWWSNCSIKRGGDLYCWGFALAGILPVGRDESSPVPAKVGSGFVSVDLPGSTFAGGGCGIKSDTTLWCWGFNYWGLFQSGLSDSFSTPQLVKVLYRKPVADGGAQITGRAKKNSVLTADAPDFSGTPIPAVTYQWYRCTKAASASSASVPKTCTKISSATGSTYTLKAAEVNKYVRLLITAKNKGGTVTILTASSAKVAN